MFTFPSSKNKKVTSLSHKSCHLFFWQTNRTCLLGTNKSVGGTYSQTWWIEAVLSEMHTNLPPMVKLITCFHDSWISEFFSRNFLCFVFLQGRSFLARDTLEPSEKWNIKGPDHLGPGFYVPHEIDIWNFQNLLGLGFHETSQNLSSFKQLSFSCF